MIAQYLNEHASLTGHPGAHLAESLAVKSQSGFRVLLIEKNSHFQHIFAFPRYAVTNAAPTHKAFIPYKASRLGQDGAVIQAGVSGLTRTAALLDREVLLDGERVRSIPFSALVSAFEKMDGVTLLTLGRPSRQAQVKLLPQRCQHLRSRMVPLTSANTRAKLRRLCGSF
jgi:hypothetical protein